MNLKVIISFLVGMLFTGIVLIGVSPSIMINEDVSKFGYEETVEKVTKAAAAKGWKIPSIHQLDKSVAKAGYDVLPVTVIELCHPGHAGKILSNDDDKSVTSMMPCRVSIYKNNDGNVIVSRMNTSLISKLFGGNISEVMSLATNDTEEILSYVL